MKKFTIKQQREIRRHSRRLRLPAGAIKAVMFAFKCSPKKAAFKLEYLLNLGRESRFDF